MSTIAQRRALLMPHAARQALMRVPMTVRTIPPVKRWGGVQLINDEEWMRDATAWKRRYARDLDTETEALL